MVLYHYLTRFEVLFWPFRVGGGAVIARAPLTPLLFLMAVLQWRFAGFGIRKPRHRARIKFQSTQGRGGVVQVLASRGAVNAEENLVRFWGKQMVILRHEHAPQQLR